MPNFTRRQAIAAGLAAPALTTLGVTSAHAAAEKLGASSETFKRFAVGDFEVTTILAGSALRDEPHSIFGLNVPADEFQAVSDSNFIPSDKARFFFSPTVVNTGSELVLFDTGLNAAGTTAALAEAGITPDQVDVVVLTHMHGDHIGGLLNEGAPTYANARYVAGSVENNHWAGSGNERYTANVVPVLEMTTFVEDGAKVASGITPIDTSGHTPGHMSYMIESNGSQFLVLGDVANHPVWSLAHPDWEVKFDMDKAAAAARRREVFDMLATDRVPFVGYHMPFPSVGFVENREDGFRFVPEMNQIGMS